MNQTQRRLFALFFVFLFALVAPTVVLFAQGYRFNLEDNIFIYSGSITIKSWPRDIEIYLDGERQTNKNLNLINGSYTINGIKPGKYTLTCSKPGYTSWEKEIRVRSGISTEFWNILLFPEKESQELETLDLTGEVKQIFLFPKKNDQLIFFAQEESSNKIYFLDKEKEESELIFETEKYSFVNKEEGFNIEWNSDNKKFILPVNDEKNQRDFLVINTEDDDTEKFISLNKFFPKDSIIKARWMFDEKDQLVVLTEDGELSFFDYKKEAIELIAENISGFDFSDYSLYYSQLPNNLVWKIKQNDFKNRKQVTTRPFILDEEQKLIDITAYDEDRIVLNSPKKTLIYNQDPKKNVISFLEPTEKISGIQFSNDGKKLLCWNEHEVWYYMLRDWEVQPKRFFGDKITITRSSEAIKNIQWMDNYENIILSTGEEIRSFEVDPRNKTNISNLLLCENSLEEKDLIYNKNNQTAYFLDNNKLFSLVLIDDSGFLGL